jgi:hypothetical protein
MTDSDPNLLSVYDALFPRKTSRPRLEPYAYVKSCYGVNPVPGHRVTTKNGTKSGTIARKRSYDQYVHVTFDGTKFDVPCHPEELIYLGRR